MTRVLFVQGAGERGGAERVLKALARRLPEHGVEVTVATLSDGPFIDELERCGVAVRRLPPAARARQIWKVRRSARDVAAVADEIDAEIIHSNGEKMALYGGRAARLAGCRSVVWLHDAPRRSLGATALQLSMRRRDDVFVAGSDWMAESFQQRLRIPAVSIPHGMDFDELPADAADLAAATGFGPDTVVFGHFARLQRWKGADVFLHAAARVAEAEPQARFVVVGGALYGWETEYAESLPRLATDLGLSDRVHFLGHRDDALALMRACDVVVHSSVQPEPLGLVVLEAQALGRPVIATRTGGPEELIDDGRTGRLATPGDADDLAGVMCDLAGDAAGRVAVGAAAAREVQTNRSAGAMAEAFAALYADTVEGSRVPTRDTRSSRVA